MPAPTKPAAGSSRAGGTALAEAPDLDEPVNGEEAGIEVDVGPVESTPSVNWSSWSNLWQIPSVVISVVLIGLGIFASVRPPASNDFDGAMAQIDKLILAGQLEPAAERLRTAIEPHLKLATVLQRARFHATIADLVAVNPLTLTGDRASNKQVCDEYAQAVDMGAVLSAEQLARWTSSLLIGGELDAARKKLAELDSLKHDETMPTTGDPPADLLATRNRVFRQLVEYTLRQPNLSYDQLMQTLADFRLNRKVTQDDELWAIARQSELRLASGLAQQAVDFLLLEMRRLESHSQTEHGPNFGELYTLLAQGYYELGDDARAKTHLEQALEQFHGSEPAHGDALVMLGSIALAHGEPDPAYEKFHLVVRDFVNTRSYLPGLLGRAEVQSVLGDHEASQADYRTLRELLPTAGPRRDITAQRVAQSLCDRHDSSLSLNRLERALEYANLAEGFFPPDHAPVDVLMRIASTNRQIADNLIKQASTDPENGNAAPSLKIDPAIRHEANVRYERAGDYYLRCATASTLADGRDDWAGSLWMGADSFDRAGKQDQAIEQFLKYLDSRPSDDSRRAEALFRVAQAHHARIEFDKAIPYYEQVIADRARSSFAAQSYVQLARCYLVTNRRPDAIAQLRQVLAGDRLLKPESKDYRDALIELGRVFYDGQEHTTAIEQFSEAVQRYPNDPRKMEIMFMLADSYRASAMAVAQKLKQEPAPSPSELGRLNTLRSEHLQMAQDFFTAVSQMYGSEADESLSELDQDMLRRARLYRADCVFYLGQYDQAIELYDQAARQYSAHQSSMYALVQIVNCYAALGDEERSAAAHHRAMVRLKQLPDSAFAVPDALMDRSAWERWLDNSPVGFPKNAVGQAGTG